MSKTGRYWFQQWARPLSEKGLLDPLSSKALEMLVEAYVDYRDLKKALASEGVIQRITITRGDVRIKPSDFIGECREARKEVKSWLQEWGMTPASRARVPVTEAKENDPFSEFLSSRED